MGAKSPFGAQELPPEKEELAPEERELLRKIAQKVVDMRMTVPAILFLESVKPLNYIGSQVMVFFEPFVGAIFNFRTVHISGIQLNEYDLFRRMMEKRDNLERLLQKIEELDAIQFQKEQEIKRKYRAEKRARRKRFWRKLLGRELPEDTRSTDHK
jgi:hypothetical protein